MSLIKVDKHRTPGLSNAFKNNSFFSDLFDGQGLIRNLFNSNVDFDFNPAMNVKEKEKEFEVELAAPGLQKEDFEITLDDRILNITAQREDQKEEEKEDFMRREFSYNSFSRSVMLPETVDENKEISAKYEDGVLRLKLLKKEGMEAKKMKTIKVS